jgi:hypothetical protein
VVHITSKPIAAVSFIVHLGVLAQLFIQSCGVANRRVAMLVRERWISFEPAHRYLQSLRRAGASPALLQAILEAKLVAPSSDSATTLGKEKQVSEHLIRGSRLRPLCEE